MKEGATTFVSACKERPQGVELGVTYPKGGLLVALTLDLTKVLLVTLVHLLVEHCHVAILLISGAKHTTLLPKGASHKILFAQLTCKQFQLWGMDQANVKIILLLGHDSQLCHG